VVGKVFASSWNRVSDPVTVFLLDDHEIVRRGVRDLLEAEADMSVVGEAGTEEEALRRIPAHVFGVLMSMEPAVAALAGFVVLGQDLGARELVAIGLVVAASAGVSIVTPPEA